MIKKRFIISLLLFFLVLTSCTPSLSFKKVSPRKPVSLTGNEVPIFGKVIFVENGEEKVFYSHWRTPTLTIIHKDSGWKREYVELENDGSFYFVVPRGTYIIGDICHGEYDYCIEPHLTFQIFRYNAFYLGTLRIEVEVKDRWVLGVWIEAVKGMEVSDEFDEAKGAFRDRYPNFRGEIVKNLMKSDGASPTLKRRAGGPLLQ